MELLYKGKVPNSDSSAVDRKYVSTRWGQVKVDLDYVDEQSALYSIDMVSAAYVDQQDALKANKVAVDAADALYVSRSSMGQPNGVASIGGDGYIPDGQLPTVVTDRVAFCVPGTIFSSGTRTVSTTSLREYVAGSLSIADPGYDYHVWAFANTQGAPTGAVPPATPQKGTTNYGRMAIITPAPANEIVALAICSGAVKNDFYTTVPYALIGATPLNTAPRSGALQLDLALSMFSGQTYTFNLAAITYYALVFPAG